MLGVQGHEFACEIGDLVAGLIPDAVIVMAYRAVYADLQGNWIKQEVAWVRVIIGKGCAVVFRFLVFFIEPILYLYRFFE